MQTTKSTTLITLNDFRKSGAKIGSGILELISNYRTTLNFQRSPVFLEPQGKIAFVQLEVTRISTEAVDSLDSEVSLEPNPWINDPEFFRRNPIAILFSFSKDEIIYLTIPAANKNDTRKEFNNVRVNFYNPLIPASLDNALANHLSLIKFDRNIAPGTLELVALADRIVDYANEAYRLNRGLHF